MRGIVFSGAAMALLGVAEPSWAQQAQSPPSDSETKLDPSASVLYDSNIVKSDRQIAAERGLVLADEIFTPGVDFILARRLASQIIYLEGNASYMFHEHDTLLNRQLINLDGGVNAHLANCQEVGTGSYSSTQEDLADETQVRVSNTIDLKTLGLSVSCGRAIGLAPQGSITQTWKDNSAALFRSNNLQSFDATGSLGYRSPAFGVLSVFGTYTEADFPDFVLPGKGVKTYGYTLYSAGVSIDRHLGGRIEGIVSLSYTDLEPDTSATSPFRGLTYSFDGTYRLNARVSLHAMLGRATTPSNQVGAEYSIKTTYEADISFTQTSRLTWNLSVSRGARDYGQQTALPVSGSYVPEIITNAVTYDVLASVNYRLNRHISVGLNAGDEERRASLTAYSYSSTRIGVTATATY